MQTKIIHILNKIPSELNNKLDKLYYSKKEEFIRYGGKAINYVLIESHEISDIPANIHGGAFSLRSEFGTYKNKIFVCKDLIYKKDVRYVLINQYSYLENNDYFRAKQDQFLVAEEELNYLDYLEFCFRMFDLIIECEQLDLLKLNEYLPEKAQEYLQEYLEFTKK
jgi:hypothetical protein